MQKQLQRRCRCRWRRNAFLNNRVQGPESTWRAAEKSAEKNGNSLANWARRLLPAKIFMRSVRARSGKWVVGNGKERMGKCVPISLQHCAYAALHIIEMANSERQRF